MIKKSTNVLFLIVLMLVIGVSYLFAQEDLLYVQAKKASVFDAPKVTAKKVCELVKGTPVKVLEKNLMWYKISTDKSEGWISKYLVSKTDPNLDEEPVKIKKINLKKHARKRASAYSSASAARGLKDGVAITGNMKSDIESISKMEESDVSEKEVKEFIKEGGLD